MVYLLSLGAVVAQGVPQRQERLPAAFVFWSVPDPGLSRVVPRQVDGVTLVPGDGLCCRGLPR